MEKVEWKVEGMTCTNCALTINQYLHKEGLSDVKVNFIGGDVSFNLTEKKSKEAIAKGITDLGYHVVNGEQSPKQKNTFFCISRGSRRTRSAVVRICDLVFPSCGEKSCCVCKPKNGI